MNAIAALFNRQAAARYGISPPRLLLIQLGIAAIVLGSGFDMLVGREHWPFSHYPMYSRIERADTTTKLHLYGVARGPDAAEFPLLEPRYIAPFDKTRLTAALQRLRREPDGEARLREALRDALDRYEASRAEGRHDGPPLQAIRLYAVTWRYDPGARNADRPDRRELLLEVRAAR